MQQDCPACGRYRAPEAERCDCGYDFRPAAAAPPGDALRDLVGGWLRRNAGALALILAAVPVGACVSGLMDADRLAPAGHVTAFRVACGVGLAVSAVAAAVAVLWLEDKARSLSR